METFLQIPKLSKKWHEKYQIIPANMPDMRYFKYIIADMKGNQLKTYKISYIELETDRYKAIEKLEEKIKKDFK